MARWPEQFEEMPVGSTDDALRHVRQLVPAGQPGYVIVNEVASTCQTCAPAETTQQLQPDSRLWSYFHRVLQTSKAPSPKPPEQTLNP